MLIRNIQFEKRKEFLIEEELNVKQIMFKEDMTEYLEYIVKPNFQVLGKTLGPKIKELQGALKNSLVSFSSGMKNIKMANLLDNEVKEFLKKSKETNECDSNNEI